MNLNSLLHNFIFPAIHLAFLLPALWNFKILHQVIGNWTILGLIGIILILSFYFYRSEIKKTEQSALNLFIPIGIFLGSFSTFFLNHELGFGPVIAAGIIGLLGSFSNQISIKNSSLLPASIYCGAFVGMSAELTDYPFVFIGISSLFASIFYQLTNEKLNGIGGKLGSIAFGGVFIAYWIVKWI